jgi:hypothetical protein
MRLCLAWAYTIAPNSLIYESFVVLFVLFVVLIVFFRTLPGLNCTIFVVVFACRTFCIVDTFASKIPNKHTNLHLYQQLILLYGKSPLIPPTQNSDNGHWYNKLSHPNPLLNALLHGFCLVFWGSRPILGS